MSTGDVRQMQVNLSWWISSLAISVVCCSILFVVFANYLFQIREDLAIARVRFDIAESRINEMSLAIEMLNRRSNVQQIQIIPGSAPIPGAENAVPPPPVPTSPPAVAPGEPPVPLPVSHPAKH